MPSMSTTSPSLSDSYRCRYLFVFLDLAETINQLSMCWKIRERNHKNVKLTGICWKVEGKRSIKCPFTMAKSHDFQHGFRGVPGKNAVNWSIGLTRWAAEYAGDLWNPGGQNTESVGSPFKENGEIKLHLNGSIEGACTTVFLWLGWD